MLAKQFRKLLFGFNYRDKLEHHHKDCEGSSFLSQHFSSRHFGGVSVCCQWVYVLFASAFSSVSEGGAVA